MTPHLSETLRRLDSLAAEDPRLERYRVTGDRDGVGAVPDGWYLSNDMHHLVTQGGWWPGHLPAINPTDLVQEMLTGFYGLEDGPDPDVMWFECASMFPNVSCYTPALRVRTPSALIFMFSASQLWKSIVFPTEAALLEAFAVTIETDGYDETRPVLGVNLRFVEWVTAPPTGLEVTPGVMETHHRLVDASAAWESSHPCWAPDTMPLFWESEDAKIDDTVAARILGVNPDRMPER